MINRDPGNFAQAQLDASMKSTHKQESKKT